MIIVVNCHIAIENKHTRKKQIQSLKHMEPETSEEIQIIKKFLCIIKKTKYKLQ